MTTAARPSLRGTVAVCRRDGERFDAEISRAWFRGGTPVSVEIDGERFDVVRSAAPGEIYRDQWLLVLGGAP